MGITSRSTSFRWFSFCLVAAIPLAMVPACGEGDARFTGPTGDECSVSGRQCDAVCDVSWGCVDCLDDADCGAANPICVGGRCEECGAAVDCDPGESCFPRDHECRDACVDNGDCDGNEPLCDSDTGACVGCFDNGDCDGDEPLCSSITQQCVECLTSDDCGAGRPMCDERGRCRECLVDAHCGVGELCRDHECELGCTQNADCPSENPICVSGDCRECADSADCGVAEPVCDEHRCVECAANADCLNPELPFCDDRECVECVNNDDCGTGFDCNNGECQQNNQG